ncbi:MAG: transposase [bacterium]|nr:transposase [bacterium]
MSKKRKYLTAEEKALVLKMYLVEKVPMSDLCDEYDLQPSQIYRWQKQLFENAAAAFRRTNKRAEHAKDRKIDALEQKLVKKNEVVAELLEDHVQLKKELGEL